MENIISFFKDMEVFIIIIIIIKPSNVENCEPSLEKENLINITKISGNFYSKIIIIKTS